MRKVVKHLFKPLSHSSQSLFNNYLTNHSKHLVLLRNPLKRVMSSGSDRGVADGAEKDQTLSSGIASVQVGVGTNDTTVRHKSSPLERWKADEQLMSVLTSMGINAMAAKKALFYTNNASAELATAWIFENPDADLDTPLELEIDNQSDSEDTQLGNECGDEVYKMVFVVNSSLEMGVGKIAAQVAHAALGMHQILLQDETKFGESLIRWFEFGETKIVLKGETTQHLIELEKKALTLGLPTYLVQDAGKTQVKSGSTTVLCLYGQMDRVDKVTGSLRLL